MLKKMLKDKGNYRPKVIFQGRNLDGLQTHRVESPMQSKRLLIRKAFCGEGGNQA